MVSDALLIRFFREASTALDELDCQALSETSGGRLGVLESRQCLLDSQRSVLLQSVAAYNSQEHTSISVDEVQAHLGQLNKTVLSSELKESKEAMEEAARMALCRLVLYSECHERTRSKDNLQSSGDLDRQKTMEFIALCQTAIKLPIVKQHLVDGTPLFNDIPPADAQDAPTASKLPHARMEAVQSLLFRAVGWDPEYATNELRRLVLEPNSGSMSSSDEETVGHFRQLMLQMNQALAQATFQASQQQLSDVDQGGVTRVLSVQYSESEQTNNSTLGAAPTTASIDPELSEDEQKQRIRVASQAKQLQDGLLNELLNMPETQRKQKLEKARQASDEFTKQVLSLQPGDERITFLQSIDPATSKLLALHKLWTAYGGAQ